MVRIGAGSAMFSDSRMVMPQLLQRGGHLDYIVYDCMSEGVLGNLSRGHKERGEPAYVRDFITTQTMPYLREILDRKIKLISNAGGLDPEACAAELREKAEAAGLKLKIAVICGDTITDRYDELVTDATRDMFDGSAVRAKVAKGKLLTLVAYSGAFGIAAALKAGADIVIAGRIVDSATTLGALIHEFGWGEDDFDLLAQGTAAGHLLECTSQVTGGTFTDWRDVPNWADIGYPIADCHPDGSFVLNKPEGTGGLLSVATVSEQLLYEVSDPQRYIVPDVVCDFTNLSITQEGKDRVKVTGARGLGRTSTAKCTVVWDDGWRLTALQPIIGLEAGAKAKRVADTLIERVGILLKNAQLPPFTQTYVQVLGGEGEGPSTAIARIVVDHPLPVGPQIMAREGASILTGMSVGSTVSMSREIRPVQHICGFLIPKDKITLKVAVDGEVIPFQVATKGDDSVQAKAPPPKNPEAPKDADPSLTVPLIKLAWARSGDKGDLFNVGVIARKPEFLPYIFAALNPAAVGAHYQRALGGEQPYGVDRFSLPGFDAMNLVVKSSLRGGMFATPEIDAAAKGMAQLLLLFPVPVSAEIAKQFAGIQAA